jgi:hypothetical protein
MDGDWISDCLAQLQQTNAILSKAEQLNDASSSAIGQPPVPVMADSGSLGIRNAQSMASQGFVEIEVDGILKASNDDSTLSILPAPQPGMLSGRRFGSPVLEADLRTEVARLVMNEVREGMKQVHNAVLKEGVDNMNVAEDLRILKVAVASLTSTLKNAAKTSTDGQDLKIPMQQLTFELQDKMNELQMSLEWQLTRSVDPLLVAIDKSTSLLSDLGQTVTKFDGVVTSKFDGFESVDQLLRRHLEPLHQKFEVIGNAVNHQTDEMRNQIEHVHMEVLKKDDPSIHDLLTQRVTTLQQQLEQNMVLHSRIAEDVSNALAIHSAQIGEKLAQNVSGNARISQDLNNALATQNTQINEKLDKHASENDRIGKDVDIALHTHIARMNEKLDQVCFDTSRVTQDLSH